MIFILGQSHNFWFECFSNTVIHYKYNNMNTVQRYRKADWSKVWQFRQFHGNFANITYFENLESLNSRWFCLGKRFQTFFGGMDVVALRWYSPAWRWKVHLDAMQFFVGVLWQNAPSVAGGTVGRQVARQSRPRVAAARQHTQVGPLLVLGMCAPTETSLLVPGANAELLSPARAHSIHCLLSCYHLPLPQCL